MLFSVVCFAGSITSILRLGVSITCMFKMSPVFRPHWSAVGMCVCVCMRVCVCVCVYGSRHFIVTAYLKLSWVLVWFVGSLKTQQLSSLSVVEASLCPSLPLPLSPPSLSLLPPSLSYMYLSVQMRTSLDSMANVAR